MAKNASNTKKPTKLWQVPVPQDLIPEPAEKPECYNQAVVAIQRLAAHCHAHPEHSDCLARASLEILRELGLFIADHTDALESWSYGYNCFPHVLVREGHSAYGGIDYLNQLVVAKHFTQTRRILRIPQKPGFNPHDYLKYLIKIRVDQKKPGTAQSSKSWTNEIYESLLRCYAYAFVEFTTASRDSSHTDANIPIHTAAEEDVDKDFFLKLADERCSLHDGISHEAALKRVIWDQLKSMLEQLPCK